MTGMILVGLGAGLTSSLIFGSAFSGSALAVMLAYLTPLPVMLAGLGWGWRSAAVGVALGTLAGGVVFGAELAILFPLLCGMPASWLSQLAMLSRQDDQGSVTWYPPGRIVTRTSWAACGLVVLAVFHFGPDAENFHANALVPVQDWIYPMLEGAYDDPDVAQAYAQSYASILLIGAASMWALLMLGNLWLAGRVIRASGRLERPWPDLRSLEMPRTYVAVLAVLIAASLLPGSFGTIAIATANVWGSAWLLVGLAVAHAVTVGLGARAAILSILYLAVFLILYVAVLVAIVGLLDPFLRIRERVRARVRARRGPPTRHE